MFHFLHKKRKRKHTEDAPRYEYRIAMSGMVIEQYDRITQTLKTYVYHEETDSYRKGGTITLTDR